VTQTLHVLEVPVQSAPEVGRPVASNPIVQAGYPARWLGESEENGQGQCRSDPSKDGSEKKDLQRVEDAGWDTPDHGHEKLLAIASDQCDPHQQGCIQQDPE
jgi:hypothetical protein